MRRRLLPSLAACGLAFGCAIGPPPHIVLITADALRADHLSGFGYERETSPHLDAFADTAWSFRRAFTVIPKTAPSFASLFTGRHPREHGVTHNFARIPEGAPVLAEALREAGYRTVAFVGNPALRPANGFARGFDLYREVARDQGVASTLRAFERWAADASWERPIFLWIHFIDPHGPYTPPPRYEALFIDDALAHSPERVRLGYDLRGTDTPNKLLGAVPLYQQRDDGEARVARYVARYDAEIRYLDDAVATVLATLDGLGRRDDTAVVFTADHGESLGEHDYYFEHGWFAFEPTLHVPLFVRAPGQTQGRRIETPVSLLDLRPTLLALAGVADPDPGRGLDLLSAPLPNDPTILIENGDRYPHKILGVRTGRWKYLRTDGTQEALYDLAADPDESEDRAAVETGTRDALRAALESALAGSETTAFEHGGETQDDPATLERLRELGYVQ